MMGSEGVINETVFEEALGANTTPHWEDVLRMLEMTERFERFQSISEITHIVVPLVITIIFVVGLIGNILVIYVTLVTKRAKKHPIHSLFVLNLSASDITYLVVSAPYQIAANTINGWPFGRFLCPMIPFVVICTTAASVFTICALAWMRFMALIIPFRFRSSRISTRRAGYIVIAVVWAASMVLALPNALYFHLVEDPIDEVSLCQWREYKSSRIYSIFLMVTIYLIPLVLVTAFYFMIGRELLCFMMRQPVTSNHRNSNAKEDQRDCAKSTMVVLCLIMAFLLCGLPHQISSILKLMGVDEIKHGENLYILKMVSHCMSYAHASVNPLIYTFASPGFRNSLRESLRKRTRKCHASCSSCDGKGVCGRVINNRRFKFTDQSNSKNRRHSNNYTVGTNVTKIENLRTFSMRSLNALTEFSAKSRRSSRASNPNSCHVTPQNSHNKIVQLTKPDDGEGQVTNELLNLNKNVDFTDIIDGGKCDQVPRESCDQVPHEAVKNNNFTKVEVTSV